MRNHVNLLFKGKIHVDLKSDNIVVDWEVSGELVIRLKYKMLMSFCIMRF